MGVHTMTLPQVLFTGEPEVCVVSVDTLSRTGGELSPWLVLTGGSLVLAGMLLLLILLFRRRSAARSTGAYVLVGTLLATGFVLGPTAPSHAATITYSEGCSIIAIDGIEVKAGASGMLPGDTETLLSLRVTNRFAGSIRLEAKLEFDDPSTSSDDVELGLATREGGQTQLAADGPLEIELEARQSTTLFATASLPLDTDNSAQEARAHIVLNIAARQRPSSETRNS